MRTPSFSTRSLSALALLALGAACQTTVIGGTGGDGGSGGTTTIPIPTSPSSSSSGATASSSSSSSSGGSTSSSTGGWLCGDTGTHGMPPSACNPTNPTCGVGTSVCLATTDVHGAPSFALRVGQMTLTEPKVLQKTVYHQVLYGATLPNLAECQLPGNGGLNWLIQVDGIAGTVTTGGAARVDDPHFGYTFLNGPVTVGQSSFPVSPVTLALQVAPDCALSTSAGDMRLPLFGAGGMPDSTLFPLRMLRFYATYLSPDHNCVGSYDAAGLAAVGCQTDDAHPAFVDGGKFEAFISLEEADQVEVSILSTTMCVLLSGDPATWGEGSPSHCKRDAGGKILFQGDWCAATNQPATAGCADAMRFAGSFAASATTVH